MKWRGRSKDGKERIKEDRSVKRGVGRGESTVINFRRGEREGRKKGAKEREGGRLRAKV